MKLNITKKLIPVLTLGVVVYGVSKVGKLNNKNINNQVNNTYNVSSPIADGAEENNIENYINSNANTVVVEENIQKKDPIIEKPEIEYPIISNIKGLEIETKKVVIPNTTVNIRSLASAESEKLGTINLNNSLDLIYQENDDWYKVRYNDKEAYISAKYTRVEEKQTIKNKLIKMVYLNKDSSLYDNQSRDKSLTEISKLEALPIYLEDNNNYITTYNNQIGYLPKEDTEDLNDTFVIVDISDQMAYLYENNELIVETPVVTGKPSTPTTKGLHKVWDISANRYLRGADYKVYVDVMMAFHNGEGLHDAEYHTHYDSKGNKTFSHGWRESNSFGGDLYKTSGSHGCVNMPHDAAMTMYENIKLGDKVLVKE